MGKTKGIPSPFLAKKTIQETAMPTVIQTRRYGKRSFFIITIPTFFPRITVRAMEIHNSRDVAGISRYNPLEISVSVFSINPPVKSTRARCTASRSRQ